MEFLQALWKYIVVAAPFLVGGLFVAGIIHVFISVDRIKKSLGGRSIFNIFKAAAFGIPLPLCSCSVLPTAVTLKKAGASNGATSSFLIATPESGVDSIAMTYGMMDIPMTIIRPIAAFFSATLAGVFQYFFNEEKHSDSSSESTSKSGAVAPCCRKKESSSDSRINTEKLNYVNQLKSIFSYGLGDLLDDMAFWLSVGLFLGAAIDFLIPPQFFSNLPNFGGRLIILLVGIPLYICASATTPIAASLVLKGMSPGMALLILLVGPATNISNIVVIQKFIGKKGVVINILAIALVALAFSYLTDFLYGYYGWQIDFNIVENHQHHYESPLWRELCGGLLILLLLKSFYFKIRKKKV